MKYAKPEKLYLSFKDFAEKYGPKNEAISSVKTKEKFNELDSYDSCGICMRDDKFTTPSGIFNLHPFKGTHWFMFSVNFCSDS